jgi:hypothetical protein
MVGCCRTSIGNPGQSGLQNSSGFPQELIFGRFGAPSDSN